MINIILLFLPITKYIVIYLKLEFQASTDSYFLREAGIPAFGFTPLNNTPVLLHDNNERIHQKSLESGRVVYTSLIAHLSHCP